MEPDQQREHGVSQGSGLRGAWRSLVSGRGGEAAADAQRAVDTVDGVGAGDQRRPWAELSPQEQTERRREAARKAAATRARNRAREAAQAKAAAAPTPIDVAPVLVQPPQPAAEPEAVDVADASAPEVEPESEPQAVEEASAESEPELQPEPQPESAELEQPADATVDLDPEPEIIAIEDDEPDEDVEPEPEPEIVGVEDDEPDDDVEPEPEPEIVGVEDAEPVETPEPEDDEPVEVVVVQSDPEASTTLTRAERPVDEGPADAGSDRAEAEPRPEPVATVERDAAPASDVAPAVVLRLDGVTRRFGSTVAVEGVDLEVRAGECHGIVGLNGAGKSTTLSIAAGLMRPTAGSVQVGGKDVRDRGVQSQLGVVPDRMRLFDRLTGRQLLVHAALLRRVPRKDAITRAATLLERFDLTPDADRLVSDYSIGMQQLVGIAAALIHAPRVVVLDEPFESIDPVATDTILSILGDLRRRGGAVVLTSHDMALVERACDHVAVLHDGVVRASGAMDDVRDGLSLEDRFTRLVGASPYQELPWLSPSLD